MQHTPLALFLFSLSFGACTSPHERPTTTDTGASDVPASGAQPDQRSPSDPRASTSLEGVEWQVVEVAGRPVAPGRGDRVASVTFAGGGVHGSSGLNSFFGPYAIDGAKLRVETLASTKMAGPPELMQQESALLAALQDARSWNVRGDELELVDVNGALLARLLARR